MKTKSTTKSKINTGKNSVETTANKENTNVSDCTKKLKQMKTASEKLGAGPIFKYICYNCGMATEVWQHIQGEIRTLPKLDRNYFGMYGFMLFHLHGKEENFDTANSDNREQRIKNALFWLRNNNRLYKSFYSNYDTLYRFDPDKIIHLHKGSDFEDKQKFSRTTIERRINWIIDGCEPTGRHPQTSSTS